MASSTVVPALAGRRALDIVKSHKRKGLLNSHIITHHTAQLDPYAARTEAVNG
jgi:hypothetical protein